MAQKRQIKKKSKTSKRMKRITVSILLLVVFLGILAVLSCTVLFHAEEITASGSDLYNQEQIIDAADIAIDDNIVIMDKEKIQEKILKKLPLIGSVDVIKKLPSKVEIKVTDAETDMAFIVRNQYLYVSQYRAVKFSKSAPKREILILADIGDPQLGQHIELTDEKVTLIHEVVSAFTDAGITKVNQIDMTDKSDISVICNGNFEVRLGSGEYLDYKAKNAQKIIESVQKKYGKNVQGIIKVQTLDNENNTSYFKIGHVSVSTPNSQKAQSDTTDVKAENLDDKQ